MVKIRFVDLFETNSFICNIFSHPVKFGEKYAFFIFNSIYHDYKKNCAFYQKII